MLEITDLAASYGEGKVLEDLSFTVESDEVVAFMGRNGAGKTTTFKSVMGVLDTVEGHISYNGESILHLPPHEVFRKGITWVPEGRRTFTNLTVEDNLRIGESGAQDTDANRDFVYDTFPRLEERKNQIAGSMSGGEKQMLALGRALISDPELLLIDEPFEGLMPTLVSELADVFKDVRDNEISMLLAGHQNDETLEIADRVVVIDGGRIVHSDDADAFLADEDLRKRYLGVDRQ